MRRTLTPEVKALDALCRTAVMTRAGAALFTDEGRDQWWGTCQHCNRPDHWLSWCHVYTRATHSTRWDLDNVWAWCSGCHRMLDQHWNRKKHWVEERIGPRRWANLTLRAETPGRKVDRAAVKLWLEREIEKLEGR